MPTTSHLSNADEIPHEILQEANEDPYLAGIIERDKDKRRVPIKYLGKVVGFYTPKEQGWDDKVYWRTGAIYVLPAYRKNGLASQAARDYFKYTERGFAFVEPANYASMAMFESIGFKKTGKHRIGTEDYWVMIKDD